MNEALLEQHTGSATTLTREQISLIGTQPTQDVWQELIELYDLEHGE